MSARGRCYRARIDGESLSARRSPISDAGTLLEPIRSQRKVVWCSDM